MERPITPAPRMTVSESVVCVAVVVSVDQSANMVARVKRQMSERVERC
jgi:hypothetical protein